MLVVASLLVVIAIGAIVIEKGEVVTIETRDAEGEPVTTRLWIVEVDGELYVRGPRHSQWIQNLMERPDVSLVRGDDLAGYRASAVNDPTLVADVDGAFSRKYGFAERWVDEIFNHTDPVAVRLEK
jgi:hypothetical protein